MSLRRLAAVILIYVLSAVAWFTLGTTLVARTGQFDSRLEKEVALLWGGRHNQVEPDLWMERTKEVTEDVEDLADGGRAARRRVTRTEVERIPLAPNSSRVIVSLALDQRQKGLLWFDTYGVRFRARYTVRNPDGEARTLGAQVKFPSTDAIYDNFTFTMNGQAGLPVGDLAAGATVRVNLAPGAHAIVELAYDSRGLGDWTYAFGKGAGSQVRDFELTMATDFDDIDFPTGTISPTGRTKTPRGWDLTWRFRNLVTGQRIGMDLPDRANPGPLAARITFFAPVSLLFFLSVMVVLGVLRGLDLHPMNYLFLSAAFFAFHLLLAYFVDHVGIHLSFAVASAASVFLVGSYLRLIVGAGRLLLQACLAQLVFLVLFSYAFFFEGYTGLAVTVGAVTTLFMLMQTTAKVDWAGVFAAGSNEGV